MNFEIIAEFDCRKEEEMIKRTNQLLIHLSSSSFFLFTNRMISNFDSFFLIFCFFY